MNFLITGNMRSRTAWFATFMNHAGVFCYHEALSSCDILEDIDSMRRGNLWGNSDSSALFFLEDLMKMYPKMKVVVIVRDVHEVMESLNHFMPRTEYSERINACLADELDDCIKRLDKSRILVVSYKRIDKDIKKIWKYCLPNKSFNKKWYDFLKDMKIEHKYSDNPKY